MTRAQIVDRLSDVMLLHGFVGSNSNLPATADDVTGLMAQLFTKGEEIVEQLDAEEAAEEARESRSPDGDGQRHTAESGRKGCVGAPSLSDIAASRGADDRGQLQVGSEPADSHHRKPDAHLGAEEHDDGYGFGH